MRYAKGDRIELARNDAYWGGTTPWEKVTLRILPQDASRVAALLSGDVQAIENVPTTDVAQLRKDKRLTTYRIVADRLIFLHMDSDRDTSPYVTDKQGKPLSRNPLKDPRVRKALSKAINRNAIVDKVMEGEAVPAGQLLADGMSNADVASRLFISQETVKSHVRHILTKLEADTRTHAVAIALRDAIID